MERVIRALGSIVIVTAIGFGVAAFAGVYARGLVRAFAFGWGLA